MSDVPPHDNALETSVLGTLLLVPSALVELVSVEGLRAAHFYRPRHRRIFEAVLALRDAGEAIDTVTVTAELREHGKLEEAGGEGYVCSLPALVGNVAAVRTCARQLVQLARSRELREGALELADAATNLDREGEARALERLYAAAAEERVRRRRTPEERQEAIMEILERRGGTVWPTPYAKLNALLAGGLRPGQFTTLAGWTSHGKSVLAVQLLAHARRHGARCALYTNEMTELELDLRSVARESGIPPVRLLQGRLYDGEHDSFVKAVRQIGHEFELIEAPGWTADEIAYDIRRERWDLVVIDLLSGLPGSAETKYLDANMATLTACSRQSGAHIIACHHLNQARHVGKAYPPVPVSADLRTSGAVGSLANNVLFVYLHESETKPGQRGTKGLLLLDKARGALCGQLGVLFQTDRMRFLPLDERPSLTSPAESGASEAA